MVLDIYTKKQLNEMLPEDSRWQESQLKKLTWQEIHDEVEEFLKTNEKQESPPVQTLLPGVEPLPKKSLKLLPMKRLTIKNRDRITEAAVYFLRSINEDKEDWRFATANGEIILEHPTAGTFRVMESYQSYYFIRLGEDHDNV